MKHIATIILSLAISGNLMSQRLTDYVDPTIGTGDHGHVFIGANVPFGMVQAGPTQVQYEWDWCSGYHHSSDSIIGFSQLHLSGTGCADLGDIALMPITGEVNCSRQGLAHTYSHSTEDTHAGYYAVTLNGRTSESRGIRCEMTATKRVALHRYTYLDAPTQQKLVIDLENATGTWDRTTDCRFQQLDDHTIIGFRDSHGWADKQQLRFAIRFSQPIASINYQDGARPKAKGKQYAVVSFLPADQCTPLLVKVALSPTSEANALLNMDTELPGWDFETTRQQADDAWEKELSRVKASFPTLRESRIFYTALFHLMVAPQLWNDCNGDYLDTQLHTQHNADHDHLTTWSLWDTYRAAHPLYTLLFPDRSRDYAHTMMDIYRTSGELPVWHLMSNETYCMVGEPGVPVLADIILKGQNADIDAEEAYRAMLSSLEWPKRPDYKTPHDSRGKNFITQYGYIPFDNSGQNETVAKNMEFFIAYWSAAQVAGYLGHKEDSIALTTISHNYRLLYDARVGYMRALNLKGEFRTTEGFNPCHQTSDYTEGNPWQYTFLVPHDVDGLVRLMGGKKAFEQKLDALFLADSDLGEHANPDVTGLIGQYAHGNEPSHHILYMYNYIDRPQKAQRYIRKVMDELYDDQPAGLCGNEDVGQMSAWYIMSALGFYQVEPCGGRYQLGCPAVREASINVGGGKTFTIRTSGNPKRAVVKRWRLNGQPLKRTYITHKDIMNGGLLECAY